MGPHSAPPSSTMVWPMAWLPVSVGRLASGIAATTPTWAGGPACRAVVAQEEPPHTAGEGEGERGMAGGIRGGRSDALRDGGHGTQCRTGAWRGTVGSETLRLGRLTTRITPEFRRRIPPSRQRRDFHARDKARRYRCVSPSLTAFPFPAPPDIVAGPAMPFSWRHHSINHDSSNVNRFLSISHTAYLRTDRAPAGAGRQRAPCRRRRALRESAAPGSALLGCLAAGYASHSRRALLRSAEKR